jgi:hypothetical protein
MRLVLVATALTSLVLPLLAGAPGAYACSCAPFPSDEAGIRAILEGDDWGNAVIVIGTAETASQSGGSGRATVTVERVFRGAIGERVELRAEGLGGSCDYIPARGSREFLILNERESGAHSASLCGSRSLDPAVDPGAAAFEQTLKAVSQGTLPGGSGADGGPVDLPDTGAPGTDASDGATTMRIIGAAVAAVAVAGLLIVLRRRAIAHG